MQPSNIRELSISKPNHSYFVVMQDFGRHGLEANVHPEVTKREVISRLVSGEYQRVVFIHYCADGIVHDVTDELLDQADSLKCAAE